MTNFDFVQHLKNQREWSEKTFGPGRRTVGIINHMKKEFEEIKQEPSDLEEWIDLVILSLDGAWRCSNATPDEIINMLVTKSTKNKERKWPDWRTVPEDAPIEHDRTNE